MHITGWNPKDEVYVTTDWDCTPDILPRIENLDENWQNLQFSIWFLELRPIVRSNRDSLWRTNLGSDLEDCTPPPPFKIGVKLMHTSYSMHPPPWNQNSVEGGVLLTFSVNLMSELSNIMWRVNRFLSQTWQSGNCKLWNILLCLGWSSRMEGERHTYD